MISQNLSQNLIRRESCENGLGWYGSIHHFAQNLGQSPWLEEDHCFSFWQLYLLNAYLNNNSNLSPFSPARYPLYPLSHLQKEKTGKCVNFSYVGDPHSPPLPNGNFAKICLFFGHFWAVKKWKWELG